jgi:two-component sensor histidine kinase
MLSVKQFQIAVIFTTIVVVMFCIPSYFAIRNTITEEKYRAVHDILEWIDVNENRLFIDGKINIPQSTRFDINIYDERYKPLYQGIKGKLGNAPDFKTQTNYPYVYYQKEIVAPDKRVFHLVVEKEIDYTGAIFLSSMLFFIVPLIIFMTSGLFIDSSVYPYKRMQEYMDNFFNDTMHELKTPLGVISINLDLLSRHTKDSKYIRRMKSAVKQMQMTYEDLEFYIKNKNISYPKEQVNFSDYLKLRLDFFEDIAVSKDIIIERKIETSILINMNKMELQRIIDNNLSNAIKYSFYQGRVKVILQKVEELRVEFIVQNEGEKIENVKNIFKRFVREDMVQGGFGLGLNIVQNICKNNNIDIDVKSDRETGTIFTYLFYLSSTEKKDEKH